MDFALEADPAPSRRVNSVTRSGQKTATPANQDEQEQSDHHAHTHGQAEGGQPDLGFSGRAGSALRPDGCDRGVRCMRDQTSLNFSRRCWRRSSAIVLSTKVSPKSTSAPRNSVR